MKKYKLCSYASRYWFVHIREGRLEEEFVPEILKSFEIYGVRDSVCQIYEFVVNGNWVATWVLGWLIGFILHPCTGYVTRFERYCGQGTSWNECTFSSIRLLIVANYSGPSSSRLWKESSTVDEPPCIYQQLLGIVRW